MRKAQGRDEAKQFYVINTKNLSSLPIITIKWKKKSTDWRLVLLIIRIENEVNSQKYGKREPAVSQTPAFLNPPSFGNKSAFFSPKHIDK